MNASASSTLPAETTLVEPPPPDITPVAASAQAKRIAGTILEVLAGFRSITEAAQVLEVAPMRYYALEARALAGLITACEPGRPGPVPGAQRAAEIERLTAERDHLKAEAARYQALARIAQTAFGPPPTVATGVAALPGAAARRQREARPTPTPRPTVKPRKKRTPMVRALRLARQVASPPASAAGLHGAGSAPMVNTIQPEDRA